MNLLLNIMLINQVIMLFRYKCKSVNSKEFHKNDEQRINPKSNRDILYLQNCFVLSSKQFHHFLNLGDGHCCQRRKVRCDFQNNLS